MRLTVIGGGGFRVPLIHRELLAHAADIGPVELTLHDVDHGRLRAIGRVLAEQSGRASVAAAIRTTTDLDEALVGADAVLVAVRVGGLAGRVLDERIALDEGVLGQETVGAGGISYALRTVPVATALAARVAALAPDAWVINLTNPAGLVTEAMAARLGDRVIGVCDSPAGLGRRVATALGRPPDQVRFDYAGLNHLGWLQAVYWEGRDVLPELLADTEALGSFEEGRLFGPEWLRALGAVPNEYLHYYYSNRETVAAAGTTATRGEFLRDQQRRCYDRLARTDGPALATWEATRRERDRTYLAENWAAAGAERPVEPDAEGGYERVAVGLLRALTGTGPATLILNVPNRGTLPGLDDEAVVEVPCTVDAAGARPQPVRPLPDHALGLVVSVKAAERAVLAAAGTGSSAAARRALAAHPLVDSVAVAGRLLDRYRQSFPELAYLKG